MTIYSDLQKNVTEFRDAQDQYWNDLHSKITHFHSDILIYFGVAGKTLRFEDDTETSVIHFGKYNDGIVETVVPFILDKNEDELALEFFVQVYMSKLGSEMVDCGLIFECSIARKDGQYLVTVSGEEIVSPVSAGKLDFTKAFDHILQKLYLHTDKSRF